MITWFLSAHMVAWSPALPPYWPHNDRPYYEREVARADFRKGKRRRA